ncbi:MAG: glycosyltransferase [Candidatus Korobacteraceae bacterium]
MVVTGPAHLEPTASPAVISPARAPRVSIIIPCYNTSAFVADTLKSVFAQTYKDYEAVVVNDGSPDTPQLEQAIAPWRDRIVYVHTDNCGLAGARNNGIRVARGELLALLDSDDLWEPNYLEVQVHKLDENPGADIVYPSALVFGDGPGTSVYQRSHGEVTFTSLINLNCVVMVSVLARRAALERAGLFDDRLRSCEDFDLWLRCVKHGSRIIYHDQILARYRRRPDSLSADNVWMASNGLRVLVKMRDAVPLTEDERRELEKAILFFEGRRLFYEGKRAFNSGDFPLAVDRLEKSNDYLHSPRIWMILRLIRTVPSIARTAYLWRTRVIGG